MKLIDGKVTLWYVTIHHKDSLSMSLLCGCCLVHSSDLISSETTSKEKNKTLDSPAMSCMEQTLGNHLMPLPSLWGKEGADSALNHFAENSRRSSTTLISKHQVHWLRQDPENHRTMWASCVHWHELKLTGDTHAKTVNPGRQAALP